MDLNLVRGKIGAHLKDHGGDLFSLRNLEYVEYFRCCESTADDASDGVCFLRSKEFSYRRAKILIGTFGSAEECQKAYSDSGGFLSDEKLAELSGLLKGLMKHHQIKTNPPEKLSAVRTRRKKINEDLLREPDAAEPPPGWGDGKWLFNQSQAAFGLGRIEPERLRSWRSEGKGPHYVKVRGRVYYTFQDLEAWASEQPWSNRTGFVTDRPSAKTAPWAVKKDG
jgi:hypothetical protein